MASDLSAPTNLRCEYLTNPLGIDVALPRLSWVLQWRGSKRGVSQSAYQIVVASDPRELKADRGDLWHSGRVESDRTTHVEYDGAPLDSGRAAFWKVRVWDQDGRETAYSDVATWEMGLLSPTEWSGAWIGVNTNVFAETACPPSPYVRREFRVKKAVRRARAYATARGIYELHLNGERVGDDFFTPGWTDYDKRIQYQTYDVTRLLRRGTNAVCMILGDGWYCGYVGLGAGRNHWGPRCGGMLELRIEYADGSSEHIATDASWKGSDGPILSQDLFMGEEFDARRPMRGWSEAGFDDSEWKPVRVDERGAVPLVAQRNEPVRKVGAVKPVKITQRPNGSYVFDMGQNMVGWVRLKVKGPAGQIVRLRFAEMLNPDGTIYTMNLRKARQTDTYVLRGGGTETWEPRFTFHGFRYVEVTGFPGKPKLDALTGVVLHSAAPPTGTFECSSPMVNRLQQNILWGQRGNFLEVPTDCPQRDERAGWMGDAQIFVRTACFNMDVAALFTKWMDDVADGQLENGALCDVSPRIKIMPEAAPAWGDAVVICPWTIYLCYGDTRILERNWGAMDQWMRYIHNANPGLVRKEKLNNNYGDWLSIEADTDKPLLSTAYWGYIADLMSKIAAVLGKENDARKYRELFEGIKRAFNKTFVADDGKLTGDTQTAYVLALRFNLLDGDKRELAARHLVADIELKGGHLSTGFLGVGYLTPVLTQAGHLDVAYRLLNNDTFPSWGYSIKHGATTIWERWDGWTDRKGFQDPTMNSFNHYSLGSVGEWMYNTVAGIDLDPERPGYKHIILRPRPGGGLTRVDATYDSIHGRIESHWRTGGDAKRAEKKRPKSVGARARFQWEVVVPPNTTATAYIPASLESAASESGASLSDADGVSDVEVIGDAIVCQLASGRYAFSVT